LSTVSVVYTNQNIKCIFF